MALASPLPDWLVPVAEAAGSRAGVDILGELGKQAETAEVSRRSAYEYIVDALVKRDLGAAQASGADGSQVAEALADLAYGIQAKGVRSFEAKDLPAALQAAAGAGKLALVAAAGSRLRLFHASVQDFLAAQHLWRLLERGEAFPAWALKEGRGSEFAVGVARFLGALAAGQGQLPLERFESLQTGLGAALRNASSAGDEEAARGLLALVPDRGALLLAQGAGEKTALELAAAGGHVAAVRALLDLAPDRRALLATRGDLQATPLHLAAGAGHAAVVRALLARSPDPRTLLEVKDAKGRTAIEWAAAGRHYGAVTVLREMDGLFYLRVPSHVQVSLIEVVAEGRGGAAIGDGRALH